MLWMFEIVSGDKGIFWKNTLSDSLLKYDRNCVPLCPTVIAFSNIIDAYTVFERQIKIDNYRWSSYCAEAMRISDISVFRKSARSIYIHVDVFCRIATYFTHVLRTLQLLILHAINFLLNLKFLSHSKCASNWFKLMMYLFYRIYHLPRILESKRYVIVKLKYLNNFLKSK